MTMVIESFTDNRSVPRAHLKRRVYEAAIALFRQKGYEAATVEEIARAARVAKGTVFNFFPAKSAILLAYYEEIDAKFGAAMSAMATADPKAALGQFWSEAEALLRKEGTLVEAIFREAGRGGDVGSADLESGDKDRDVLTAYFRACRREGTLSDRVEPAVAAHIVGDLWSATVMDWLRAAKRYSLKLRLAAKLDAVFKGFAPLLLIALLAAAAPQAHATDLNAMEGLYEDNTGAVAVTRFGEFGGGLFYIDYASGRVGAVVDKGDRAAVGVGLAEPKSDAGDLVRTPAGLRAEVDGAARSLRAVPLARESFTVLSGGADLAGEIVHRTGAQPKGTIVIVHGSNDSPRESYGPWVFYLAARGWSVAVFDKRGSGLSTGDWQAGGFEDLASDVRAVAAYARARLPGRKLGLLGISQAGWVMPLAAKDGGIDFIVSLMGPGVTPAEQTMETVIGQLQGYGFAPAEIEQAVAYYRLDLDVTLGKRAWADIDAAYKKAIAAKVEWILAPPQDAHSPARRYLARIAHFDAGPCWAKVHVPVLAMFGGKDSLVPVKPNRALVGKMLAHERAARTVVLARANHVGMIAKTGTFAEYPALDHFDPAYFKTFGDWLEARVRS